MIKFDHVYKRYVKDYFTLFDFDLEVDQNTLFVGDDFLGTGAIMRLLANIDKPNKGEIFVDNKKITKFNKLDFPIAFVAKKAPLFENKTIFENLHFIFKIRKINKNFAENAIKSLFLDDKIDFSKYFLEFFEFSNDARKPAFLEKLLNLKIKELNKSLQKIVVLLRAILRKPKYILIENLFEDLDPKYHELATQIIESVNDSTIIATETNIPNCYKNFNIIYLEK